MSVKFIHIRRGIGAGMQEKGGTTIAYSFNPESRQAAYAVAHCSSKDNYCKKIGRDVATGRLLNNKGGQVTVPEGESVANFIANLAV